MPRSDESALISPVSSRRAGHSVQLRHQATVGRWRLPRYFDIALVAERILAFYTRPRSRPLPPADAGARNSGDVKLCRLQRVMIPARHAQPRLDEQLEALASQEPEGSER